VQAQSEKLDSEYWTNRYLNQEAGWDMGQISPPLKAYFDQLSNKDIAILIPGCGNAYEAEYLIQQGFTNITLIDISPFPVNRLKEKFASCLGKQIHIICADFFELTPSFDLIIEQTFFCALDPILRNQYAEKMFESLKPGGKLVGVFFNTEFDAGPPFSGSKQEYEELFSKKFEIKVLTECYNSILPRSGKEVFIQLERK
jgi:SAM-dependent methyltransferase